MDCLAGPCTLEKKWEENQVAKLSNSTQPVHHKSEAPRVQDGSNLKDWGPKIREVHLFHQTFLGENPAQRQVGSLQPRGTHPVGHPLGWRDLCGGGSSGDVRQQVGRTLRQHLANLGERLGQKCVGEELKQRSLGGCFSNVFLNFRFEVPFWPKTNESTSYLMPWKLKQSAMFLLPQAWRPSRKKIAGRRSKSHLLKLRCLRKKLNTIIYRFQYRFQFEIAAISRNSIFCLVLQQFQLQFDLSLPYIFHYKKKLCDSLLRWLRLPGWAPTSTASCWRRPPWPSNCQKTGRRMRTKRLVARAQAEWQTVGWWRNGALTWKFRWSGCFSWFLLVVWGCLGFNSSNKCGLLDLFLGGFGPKIWVFSRLDHVLPGLQPFLGILINSLYVNTNSCLYLHV